ncbi:MAG TPA: hypothetical protein VJX92_22745 [Methylomirabilota bacterium]|nr:hypothetical protein [Methylomirabilota bacterium]
MLGAVKVGEVVICAPLAALSGVLGIVVPGTVAGGGLGVPVLVLGV